MTDRVVVVGGGFGGLLAARGLRQAPVEVTLVDRQNFHLFQPLAYQVATGALSPAEIAVPLRAVLKRQGNARVLLAEVTGFDLERQEVVLARLPNGDAQATIGYDTLVVAGGSRYSYFGHDDWQPYAPELKSLDGRARDPQPHPRRVRGRRGRARRGAPAELAHVRRRRGRPDRCRDGGADRRARARHAPARLPLGRYARARACCSSRRPDRVLTSFPESLSRKAARALEQLGVTPLVGHTVVDVTADSVGDPLLRTARSSGSTPAP